MAEGARARESLADRDSRLMPGRGKKVMHAWEGSHACPNHMAWDAGSSLPGMPCIHSTSENGIREGRHTQSSLQAGRVMLENTQAQHGRQPPLPG